LYKKAGNDYKLTPFKIGPAKFCDYIQNHAVFYDQLLKDSDVPQKKDCPWKAKTYHIYGFRLPMEKIPRTFVGDYLFEIRLTQDDELKQGYQVYVSIIVI
jgi:Protein of unknown function (DUF1091)